MVNKIFHKLIKKCQDGYFIIPFMVLILLIGCTASTPKIEARLGQEFSLHIGETAAITGENISLKFLELIGDSRCPKDVQCIWQGEARCMLEISKTDVPSSASQLEITTLGFSGQPATVMYEAYKIAFRVEPYPEAGKSIAKTDYRLVMTVNH
jgi:hypothetical protein